MPTENEQPKNYVELTNDLVLKTAKKEIEDLKKSLGNIAKNPDKKTINGTRKLNEINKLIQESELDNPDKEEFMNALNALKEKINNNRLNKLQENFDTITELLERLIQNELNSLDQKISGSQRWDFKTWSLRPKRPNEIEEEIKKSSEKIPQLINDAKDDKSWFIRTVIARLLERANS